MVHVPARREAEVASVYTLWPCGKKRRLKTSIPLVGPLLHPSTRKQLLSDALSEFMATRGVAVPPAAVPPAAAAAATPRARNRGRATERQAFVPDLPEPTIVGGSPRLRRTSASRLSAEASEFCYEDMRPIPLTLPTGTLTDDAMRRAFGHSPLLCTSHTPVTCETEIGQDELDRLKTLNVDELLCHFRGEDNACPPGTPLSAQSSGCSYSGHTPFPPTVAGFEGTRHWPSL